MKEKKLNKVPYQREFDTLKVLGKSFLWFLARNNVPYIFADKEKNILQFHNASGYEMALSLWYNLTGSDRLGRL